MANVTMSALPATQTLTAEPTDISETHFVNQEMFTKHTEPIPATTPAQPQPAVQVQQTTS